MGIPTDFYPLHIRDSPAVIEIIVKYDTLPLFLYATSFWDLVTPFNIVPKTKN